MSNPLLSDRFVDFLLYEVHDAEGLTRLPDFAEHGRETFDLFLGALRRFGRETLLPTYRRMDLEPPTFDGAKVHTHPALPAIYRGLVELGCVAATRPADKGGAGLPQLVYGLASAYVMAGNLGACGFAGLTSGAAHLLEAFASEELQRLYREPMLEGRFTGTMALTEPQAGSSLADLTTKATPRGDGSYLIRGSKIFISGGDHTVAENVVHMVLARIEGAPEGTRGISLFCVPQRRVEGGALLDNDVAVAGLLHKIGWRALPSLALEFGEKGECRGWLVGQEHQGLRCMFQMMNEARLMVGLNAASTASVAYHESRLYALSRPQGRKSAGGPQVPIVEHADVRRMLLRQKAIVEGALSLLAECLRAADVAEHGATSDERASAQQLLDLLTPIAKTFPSEAGFESTSLAVQVLGGYGYTSEYLPEAYLRDQKLNSIHEGTTGIQSLDLLGRKVMAKGGAPLMALAARMQAHASEARAAGVDGELVDFFERALGRVGAVTMVLGQKGAGGDVDAMLAHSADYLAMLSIVCVAWQWLRMWSAAKEGEGAARAELVEGIRAAARYWLRTELPRAMVLADLCEAGERSYVDLRPEALG